MRLYLIRHADPDNARNDLTPLGHREAAALATRFARHEGLTHLYSSPLARAAITARYLADATGLTPRTLDWTTELDMTVPHAPPTCTMAWDQPGELLRKRTPAFTKDNWHQGEPFASPDYAQVWSRVRAGSDALLADHGFHACPHGYRIARPSKDRVAVVCHKGLGLTWLAHLLDLPVPLVWSGFWIAPASVTCLVLDERSPDCAVPRALWINDQRHLHAEGLPPNPHGIKGNFD